MEKMAWISYLRELNVLSLTLRIVLAVFCGGIIGYERGKHQEAAGFRTHILVCVGSACTMLVGQYMVTVLGQNTDPARIGSQVVSGIGFIGAGTIILNSRHQIKGVTTAAGLWASAAMGLAVGVGFYECAVIMCIVLHFTLKRLNQMDDQYVKLATDARIYMEYEKDFHFSQVVRALRENGWRIVFLEPVTEESAVGASVQFIMRGEEDKGVSKEEMLEKIRKMQDIWYVEEL